MCRQGIALVILMATPLAARGQDRALALHFADREAWHSFADEPWWSLVDIRNMLNVFHPLTIPQTGNAAGAWREVTIPADWKHPSYSGSTAPTITSPTPRSTSRGSLAQRASLSTDSSRRWSTKPSFGAGM